MLAAFGQLNSAPGVKQSLSLQSSSCWRNGLAKSMRADTVIRTDAIVMVLVKPRYSLKIKRKNKLRSGEGTKNGLAGVAVHLALHSW